MTTEIKAKDIRKWVNALRSGKFEQTVMNLQTHEGFCCLGVACKIFIPSNKLAKSQDGTMVGGSPLDQPLAPAWLKMVNENFGNKTGVNLMTLNDQGLTNYVGLGVGSSPVFSLTFDEIADLLEAVYIQKVLE
jgi:hypothetical protein